MPTATWCRRRSSRRAAGDHAARKSELLPRGFRLEMERPPGGGCNAGRPLPCRTAAPWRWRRSRGYPIYFRFALLNV
jgi:hypothetical protein